MGRGSAAFVTGIIAGVLLGFPVAGFLAIQEGLSLGYWALYGMSAAAICLIVSIWVYQKTLARDQAHYRYMEEEYKSGE